MTKERANEIMKELKGNCKSCRKCIECVFYCDDNAVTHCKLLVKTPVLYKIEDILDEKEKEYLSNIVKPFRNRVEGIRKCGDGTKEYIEIWMQKEVNILLPSFDKNTMYKGMEKWKKYTLEELDI
jgi:hypothetical protein